MKYISSRQGFTLVELMMVVTIIGILTAAAGPKFGDLVTKSREGAAKGNLGAIRSALAIYYANTEGFYPATGNLESALTAGSKYINELPSIQIPAPGNHGKANSVVSTVTDAGDWLYSNDVGDGHVAVNCTHLDTKSSVWSAW